jgi:hypothetical protein
MREQNRRDLLKGGVGIAAGALAIGAGVAPGADAETVASLTVDARTVRARVHGKPHGRLPKLDDHVTIHGVVTDGRGVHGTFGVTGVVVRHSGTDELAFLEHHVFALADGTLTGAGQRTGEGGVFAITGGTGRFAGAAGSYVAQLSPSGLGGDGTARFEFALATQER